MKCLITGGLHYPGIYMLWRINAERIFTEVFLVDDFEHGVSPFIIKVLAQEHVKILANSILDTKGIASINTFFDVVIHFPPARKNMPSIAIDSLNRWGTYHLLGELKERTERFIYIVPHPGQMHEPGEYERSISASVSYVKSIMQEKWTIIYTGHVYGLAPLFLHEGLNAILADAIITRMVRITGNPEVPVAFTHISWLYDMIKAPQDIPHGECFAPMVPITLKEVVSLIKQHLVPELEVMYVNYWQNPEYTLAGFCGSERIATPEKFIETLREWREGDLITSIARSSSKESFIHSKLS